MVFINATQSASQIVSKIIKMVEQKFSPEEAKIIIPFIHPFFATVAEDELQARDVSDLYGAVISHWRFMNHRKDDEIKLKVFNPTVDHDGWQSPHTVIEISQTDMPFLVDTVLMRLNQLQHNIHLIVHTGCLKVVRDKKDYSIKRILETGQRAVAGTCNEAVIYIEIDRQSDNEDDLKHIETSLLEVLKDVRMAVDDFKDMKKCMAESIRLLKSADKSDSVQVPRAESLAFLEWVNNDHFIFLGYAEYKTGAGKQNHEVHIKPKSCKGILRDQKRYSEGHFIGGVKRAHYSMTKNDVLIAKSDYRASVHRPAYMDIVGVNIYDDKGTITGERVFVGLFTSLAYHSDPKQVPLLHYKYEEVIKRSGFDMRGHAGKALANVLETFPRDEFFQIDIDELYRIATGILQIQERHQIKLFIRPDTLGRYYTAMVFVPRDMYNTDMRIKIQQILMEELSGYESTFRPNFLESILARVDYVIRTRPSKIRRNINIKRIENRLVIACRDWSDELRSALIEMNGEHSGLELFNIYSRAFPAGYREAFIARSAAADILHIESTRRSNTVGMSFYRMLEDPDDHIRFKLFQKGTCLPLTDILPMLENMGVVVLDERPFCVRVKDEGSVWISDFGMKVPPTMGSIDEVSAIFQEAFVQIIAGNAEDDGFNQLVMRANMRWRDILVLRAYTKYLLQIGFRYSQSHIEATLNAYPAIAHGLVALFKARFNPELTAKERKSAVSEIEASLHDLLEKVDSLDRDLLLRQFLALIKATLRTGYYQQSATQGNIAYLNFKLSPKDIPYMPKPWPLYEIFVYSPRFEGIHLRGAKVARGGLRWSDRREDFRTEVLGLMKAQQVKNAVIVPLGAKGGFVPKALPHAEGRDAVQAEAIACYKEFISALLDLTDNLKAGKVVSPENVVRYDEDDPYLVVAADKGTATFSDFANEVAIKYGFWLGDAFASGGSNGYDHKKMGITARGAWESVKRHFRTLNHDVDSKDFTVIGVGDMAGDVFGNGMLLSQKIRLVAAFNHIEIFIDPNPDSKTSFKERQRLFKLPRSSWKNYNPKLISKGGGVFDRSAKTIQLSPEIRKLLKVRAQSLSPNELIRHILMADVDLLWNGGIGTYVRASHENDASVGDPANAEVRIAAEDLNCRVIGEGGNLGLTQLGRIEFAINGGAVNTDAIDNSAGVDCSDHEVNIKILLNAAVDAGAIKPNQRNKLLADMQTETGQLVLENNYAQNQAIGNADGHGNSAIHILIRLMHELERDCGLDRELEFLPTDKALFGREAAGQGFTAPEYAVLMAYSKTAIKKAILNSDLPDQAYCDRFLESAFPKPMREQFSDLMRQHRLSREIIATQITNMLVRYMGVTFVVRLFDETGASSAMIAQAFLLALDIFEIETLWRQVQKLDGVLPVQFQRRMYQDISKMLRRVVRWLIRSYRGKMDMLDLVSSLRGNVRHLRKLLPKLLCKADRQLKKEVLKRYHHAEIPTRLGHAVADCRFMTSALDVIYVVDHYQLPIDDIASMYFKLNDSLSFSWVRRSISQLDSDGYWGMLASSGLRDDMDKLQRLLVTHVLKTTDAKQTLDQRLQDWLARSDYLVTRWRNMVEDLKASQSEFVMYQVAMRALLDLVQGARKMSPEDDTA